MTNIKKIGLTALAASLVSTSAFAADLKVKGGASLGVSGLSGNGINQRTAYTMANQLTFTGSGELENGLKVSLSFQLDQGDADGNGPFDDHSIKIASEPMGTLTFHGHGGKSTTTSIGSTVSGAIWDDYDGISGATDLLEAGVSNGSFLYTSPQLVEGLTLLASLNTGVAATVDSISSWGYGVTYTGVEGLSASYADAEIESKTPSKSGDQKLIKATYAFGPVTVGYAQSNFETGNGSGSGIVNSEGDDAQDATSVSVSYSISENLSVSYGSEEFTSGNSAAEKPTYQRVSTAYTDGGMTISSELSNAENIAYGTASNQDVKYFELGLAFNF